MCETTYVYERKYVRLYGASGIIICLVEGTCQTNLTICIGRFVSFDVSMFSRQFRAKTTCQRYVLTREMFEIIIFICEAKTPTDSRMNE